MSTPTLRDVAGVPPVPASPWQITSVDEQSRVIVGEDGTEAEWDRYVATHADATSSHLWPWRRVFENVLGQRCIYLVARRRGAISGILPVVAFRSRLFGRSMVSLPFLNDGGLLTSDSYTSGALLAHAAEIAKEFGAAHVELRHRRQQMPSLPCRAHKIGLTMPLRPSVDDLWDGLDRKVRNQIRKAQKSDLEVESGGSVLVDDFYTVFARNMRDLGTPVYSSRLFSEILQQFPGQARLFIVRHGGKPVAGAMTIHGSSQFEVPWASSLLEYRHLCPNMLLYWSMIQFAATSGCSVFDFGRSSPGGGTHQFKTQWGAIAQPLHWEYVLLDRASVPDFGPGNPRFSAAIRTWKRLPVWLTTCVGPAIVRNIP